MARWHAIMAPIRRARCSLSESGTLRWLSQIGMRHWRASAECVARCNSSDCSSPRSIPFARRCGVERAARRDQPQGTRGAAFLSCARTLDFPSLCTGQRWRTMVSPRQASGGLGLNAPRSTGARGGWTRNRMPTGVRTHANSANDAMKSESGDARYPPPHVSAKNAARARRVRPGGTRRGRVFLRSCREFYTNFQYLQRVSSVHFGRRYLSN